MSGNPNIATRETDDGNGATPPGHRCKRDINNPMTSAARTPWLCQKTPQSSSCTISEAPRCPVIPVDWAPGHGGTRSSAIRRVRQA